MRIPATFFEGITLDETVFRGNAQSSEKGPEIVPVLHEKNEPIRFIFFKLCDYGLTLGPGSISIGPRTNGPQNPVAIIQVPAMQI